MSAWNGPDSYGWVTRLLHWLMAIAIVIMLGYGTYLARTQPTLETLWLYGLHKSVGLTLLALAFLRILWHRLSPPPPPLPGAPSWQDHAARFVHRLLYVLMILVPVAGYVGSTATGIDTVYFGWFKVPALVPASEAWDKAGFLLHRWLARLLLLLVLIHIVGAIKRQTRPGDRTLWRMLVGR